MIYVLNDRGTPYPCGDIATLAAKLGRPAKDFIDPEWLKSLSGEDSAVAQEGFGVPDEAVINLPSTCEKVEEADWSENGSVCRYVSGQLVLGKPADILQGEAEEAIRAERYTRLRQCDKISPMRWNTMTEEQRTAWEEYRQALLDVPQQEGFPWGGDVNKVAWPVKPE